MAAPERDAARSGPVPEPMLARAVEALPRAATLAGGCLYEPKWDGYRAMLRADHANAGGVRILSRRHRDLTPMFPEIAAAAAEQLHPGTLLDGELVVWHQGSGQLDFAALQRRAASPRRAGHLSVTEPASYVAFDVLVHGGEVLSGRPLRERRRELEALIPTLAPPLQVTPATRDEAIAAVWLRDYADAAVGIEGLVIKALAHPYRPGRRDWLKLRTRDSVEAIVGAVTGTRARPERVILGLPGPGGLVIAGSTVPLKPGQQRELAGHLTRPAGEHPWPSVIPAGRTGTWSREPLRVTLVDPTVVIEVDADTAYEYGRWRHLVRYLRARSDLTVADIAPIA